jgi:hypothetical protein
MIPVSQVSSKIFGIGTINNRINYGRITIIIAIAKRRRIKNTYYKINQTMVSTCHLKGIQVQEETIKRERKSPISTYQKPPLFQTKELRKIKI